MSFAFEKTLHISLSCTVVPLQYRPRLQIWSINLKGFFSVFSSFLILSFSQSSGPVHSLPLIHGKAGASHLCLHNDTMYSAGRDGVYRQLRIQNNTMEVIDTKKVFDYRMMHMFANRHQGLPLSSISRFSKVWTGLSDCCSPIVATYSLLASIP